MDDGDTETVTLDRIIEILNSQRQEIEALRNNIGQSAVILEEVKAEAKKGAR